MVAAAAAIGFGTFLALHVMLWRARPSSAPRIVLLTALALIGIAVAWLTTWSRAGADPIALCATLWIEAFLIIGYFFLYAGLARSVSLTLLEQLRRAGAQPMAFQALLAAYAASRRFEERIHVMDRSRLVRVEHGAVRLTSAGRALSRGVTTLSRLLATELSG